MAKIKTYKIMEISVYHLTFNTGQLLSRGPWRELIDSDLIWYVSPTDYSWCFLVPEDGDSLEGVPSELIEIFNYARSKKCDWVAMDTYYDEFPDLPLYTW